MADYFLSFQGSIDDLLTAADYLIDSRPDLEAALLFKTAQTLELAGDYARSFDYYLRASEKSTTQSEKTKGFLNAAGLSLLMGETSKGEALIEKILPQCEPGREKAEALLLLSQLLFYQDRGPESLKALTDSLSEEKTPAALFWKEYTGQGIDDSSELAVQYPESLSELLRRGELIGKIEPLFLGLAPLEDTARESPLNPVIENGEESLPLPTELGAIQTGSFVDEENARELQKDLEKLGYQTEIRISERNSRTYHQVLIVGIDKNMLRDELNKLRSRGFDGFITQ